VTAGLPCAVVYGLYVLSPVNQRLPPSPARCVSIVASLAQHGRARTTRLRRPRRCRTSDSTSTSTAFRPTFVTTRTPLMPERNARVKSRFSKIRNRFIFYRRAGQGRSVGVRLTEVICPSGIRRWVERNETHQASTCAVIPGRSKGPNPESRDSGFALSARPGMTLRVGGRLYCDSFTKSGNFSFPSAIAFGQTVTCFSFCHWNTRPVIVPGPDLMPWVNSSSLP